MIRINLVANSEATFKQTGQLDRKIPAVHVRCYPALLRLQVKRAALASQGV